MNSCADGVVRNISLDQDGLYTITMDYGSNLQGWHAHIASTDLSVGDLVLSGELIGVGRNVDAGHKTSAYGLVDLGRVDGPAASDGGVLVSPFDYLNDTSKHMLVDRYKLEVADHFNLGDENSKIWGFEPYQPYLTNKIRLHEANTGELSGVWRISSSATAPGFPHDTMTFIEAATPYYTGNVVMARDQDDDEFFPLRLDGVFEVDYASGRLIINTADGIIYYGIFEVDENSVQPVLKIEYQADQYPERFTANSLIYQLAE